MLSNVFKAKINRILNREILRVLESALATALIAALTNSTINILLTNRKLGTLLDITIWLSRLTKRDKYIKELFCNHDCEKSYKIYK